MPQVVVLLVILLNVGLLLLLNIGGFVQIMLVVKQQVDLQLLPIAKQPLGNGGILTLLVIAQKMNVDQVVAFLLTPYLRPLLLQ